MVWVVVALGMGRGASGRERSLEKLAGAGPQRLFMPRNLDLKFWEMRRPLRALRKIISESLVENHKGVVTHKTRGKNVTKE